MRPVRRKVIISCAVTGSDHTPSMSDFLPFTPEQIARQAVEAAHAGASLLYLHARDPVDGSPTCDPDVFDTFVPRIAAETDAIIAVSTAGDARMTIEERLAYPLRSNPELCAIDMGATNFAPQKTTRAVTSWKFEWEKAFVEGAENLIHGNTLGDIKAILSRLGHRHDMRFEFMCHDLSHLYNVAHVFEEGFVEGPLFLQCRFGMPGGMGSDPESIFLVRGTADRLFGRGNYEISVLGCGRHQISLATMGALMGGHVRVGLADSLFLSKGLLATSCAAQVLKIRRILEDLSFEIASPDEARETLGTRGGGRLGEAAAEVGLNG